MIVSSQRCYTRNIRQWQDEVASAVASNGAAVSDSVNDTGGQPHTGLKSCRAMWCQSPAVQTENNAHWAGRLFHAQRCSCPRGSMMVNASRQQRCVTPQIVPQHCTLVIQPAAARVQTWLWKLAH